MTSTILDALAASAQRLASYSEIHRIIPDHPPRHVFTAGWEFCNITPGCTLRAGHSGDCKLAKGF